MFKSFRRKRFYTSCFFPSSGRFNFLKIHIDNADDWCLNKDPNKCSPDQSSLLQVLMHEIGHILGMRHSNNQLSTMFPLYTNNNSKLGADDIFGIQSMNGLPDSIMPTSTTTVLNQQRLQFQHLQIHH